MAAPKVARSDVVKRLLHKYKGEKLDEWPVPTLDEWEEGVGEDTPWLVPGWIPENSFGLMSGQQKRACKTWTAFQLALCVACPEATFDAFKPTRYGPVLIVEEEGTAPQTKARLQMIKRALGIKKTPNVHFVHHNHVKLDDERWRARLLAKVESLQPALVILDALSYMHDGDENSVREMSPTVETLRLMRGGGTSIIVLAHLDKTKGENKRSDIDTQVRGSSLIVNAYDSHIALRRYKMTEEFIQCTVRHRDADETHCLLRWHIDDAAVVKEPKARLQLAAKPSDEAEIHTETFNEKCLEALEPGELYTLDQLRALLGVSDRHVKRVMRQLADQKLISIEGNKYRTKNIDSDSTSH